MRVYKSQTKHISKIKLPHLEVVLIVIIMLNIIRKIFRQRRRKPLKEICVRFNFGCFQNHLAEVAFFFHTNRLQSQPCCLRNSWNRHYKICVLFMRQGKIGIMSLILKRGFQPIRSYLTTEPVYIRVIIRNNLPIKLDSALKLLQFP